MNSTPRVGHRAGQRCVFGRKGCRCIAAEPHAEAAVRLAAAETLISGVLVGDWGADSDVALAAALELIGRARHFLDIAALCA